METTLLTVKTNIEIPEVLKQLFGTEMPDHLKTLVGLHGQICSIKYKTNLKFYKQFDSFFGERVMKRLVRVGINYENRAMTVEKRESGIPPTGLRGFEWVCFPHLLKNKIGKYHVRFYPFGNNIPGVEYFLNGQSIEKNQIESYLLSSELESSIGAECINIKLENILEINGK